MGIQEYILLTFIITISYIVIGIGAYRLVRKVGMCDSKPIRSALITILWPLMLIAIGLAGTHDDHKEIHMAEYNIPPEEVTNVVSVFWQMMRELESETNSKKDLGKRVLVEGAYNVANRINLTPERPTWEKKKKEKLNYGDT